MQLIDADSNADDEPLVHSDDEPLTDAERELCNMRAQLIKAEQELQDLRTRLTDALNQRDRSRCDLASVRKALDHARILYNNMREDRDAAQKNLEQAKPGGFVPGTLVRSRVNGAKGIVLAEPPDYVSLRPYRIKWIRMGSEEMGYPAPETLVVHKSQITRVMETLRSMACVGGQTAASLGRGIMSMWQSALHFPEEACLLVLTMSFVGLVACAVAVEFGGFHF